MRYNDLDPDAQEQLLAEMEEMLIGYIPADHGPRDVRAALQRVNPEVQLPPLLPFSNEDITRVQMGLSPE